MLFSSFIVPCSLAVGLLGRSEEVIYSLICLVNYTLFCTLFIIISTNNIIYFYIQSFSYILNIIYFIQYENTTSYLCTPVTICSLTTTTKTRIESTNTRTQIINKQSMQHKRQRLHVSRTERRSLD